MNILERITKLERKDNGEIDKVSKLTDRIDRLEEIIESLGYYIPKKQ